MRSYKLLALMLCAESLLFGVVGCGQNPTTTTPANPSGSQSQTATKIPPRVMSSELSLEHTAVPLTEEQLAKVNGNKDADIATSITVGKQGGTMIYGSFGEGPKDFNPISANDSASNDILALMYAPLISFNYETQDYQPALLKQWVMSPTNKCDWTLSLREGLKWSDGEPLNADDVMFTINTIYNELNNPAKDILKVDGKPVQFTKIDDVTVSATIAAPSASFPMMMSSFVVIPQHTLQASIDNKTFAQVLNTDAKPESMICSGPYKLKQYENGQRVILERNPHYYRFDANGTRLPYIDTIIVTYSPDQDQQLLSFKAGQTDAFAGPRAQSIPDLLDEQSKGNYTVYECGPGESTSVFWFNMKRGKNEKSGNPYVSEGLAAIFDNLNFRQACMYAIDKESIIATELRGLAQSAWSMVSPALGFWYNPDVPHRDFNVEKAKQLLDEANITDRDGDGIREAADGTKVSFVFVTNKGNKSRENIATLISQDLRNVGIDAKPQFIDFTSLVTKIQDTHEYDACLLGFGGSIHPTNSMNLYLSSGRTHFWNPEQASPATPWEAQVDKLCSAFNTTIDTKQQQKCFFEIQSILAEACPYLPLFTSTVFVVARNKFENLKPTPFSGLLWNIDEVFLKN